MAGPWSLGRLAAIAGETEDHLRWCVDAGLLHRQPDGDFDPDSLNRLRLIQFARTRGVSDQRLAATTARHGDLLGVFGELTQSGEATLNLADTSRELGLEDALIGELAEIVDSDDVGSGINPTSPRCG